MATKAGKAQATREEVHPETGEVTHVPIPTDEKLLGMIDAPELRVDGDENIPVLGWDDSAEVRGGDLTSLGFARLVPGFAFSGYVLNTSIVDSQFDSPAGKRKQEVYNLRGTARVPIQGADKGAFAEVRGNLQIPIYARLAEAIEKNREGERTLGRRIPVRITYEGQGTPRTDDEGKVVRSGSHIFRVVRLQAVKPK